MSDDVTVCPWCLVSDSLTIVMSGEGVVAVICEYHLSSLAARAKMDPRRLFPHKRRVNDHMPAVSAPAHSDQPDSSDVSPPAGGMEVLGDALAGRVASDPAPVVTGKKRAKYDVWPQPGEAHHSAKLTQADVSTIQAMYSMGGISQRGLARRYGVSASTIADILAGRTWAEAK